MQICESDSGIQTTANYSVATKEDRCAYILQLRFLDKKCLSIVTELHVQVNWLAIHFNVNLEESDTSTSSLEKHYLHINTVYKPQCASQITFEKISSFLPF